MSPEQRKQLRERFEGFRKLDPEHRHRLLERHRKHAPKGKKHHWKMRRLPSKRP
jgi:hypothetical protein